MSKNAPVLSAESVGSLRDEQLIAWYSKHPNATVRALVDRIAYNNDVHKGELINAYQSGFAAAQDHFSTTGPEPFGLTPEELRIGAIYARLGEEL